MIDNKYKMGADEKPKKVYDPLPDDTYEVQVSKLELRKDQPIYNSSQVEDKFNFEFTIVEEGQFKGRKVWKEVRTVFNPGSNGYSPSGLYQIFSAITGSSLTKEESVLVSTEDINNLEGGHLRVIVKQKPKLKGGIKNVVSGFLASKIMPPKPQPSQTPPPQPSQIPDIKIDDSDIPF